MLKTYSISTRVFEHTLMHLPCRLNLPSLHASRQFFLQWHSLSPHYNHQPIGNSWFLYENQGNRKVDSAFKENLTRIKNKSNLDMMGALI